MSYSALQTRVAPATEHPIMQIPGVVTQTFCIESLHTNELGVLSHFTANVFLHKFTRNSLMVRPFLRGWQIYESAS